MRGRAPTSVRSARYGWRGSAPNLRRTGPARLRGACVNKPVLVSTPDLADTLPHAHPRKKFVTACNDRRVSCGPLPKLQVGGLRYDTRAAYMLAAGSRGNGMRRRSTMIKQWQDRGNLVLGLVLGL